MEIGLEQIFHFKNFSLLIQGPFQAENRNRAHFLVYFAVFRYIYIYPRTSRGSSHGCHQSIYRTFVETPDFVRGVKNCNGRHRSTGFVTRMSASRQQFTISSCVTTRLNPARALEISPPRSPRPPRPPSEFTESLV